MTKQEANSLFITIPKTYDFSEKLRAIKMPSMYAYYYINKKPVRDYKYVIILHNGTLYLCRKYVTSLGIGFHGLLESKKTKIKGFQGFRYINWKDLFRSKDEITSK